MQLLLVDDNNALRTRLARALAQRGFQVHPAAGLLEAETLFVTAPAFTHAVIDLRLGEESGLSLVPTLKARDPGVKVLILTGYGNIATAVAAIKAGAVDYLPKPADADQITAALLKEGAGEPPAPLAEPMTPARLKWEHIQRVYLSTGGNVSQTARSLKMHRRTLQRILAKHAPRN